MKSILVPVDFSKDSINALEHAISIANQVKASIRILHVRKDKNYDEPFIIRGKEQEYGKTVEEFMDDIVKENKPRYKGEGDFDYVYRAFAPLMGINEDPGTGIVNCIIGHYWGQFLGKKRMNVHQPSERGSEFIVETVENGVRITGKATSLIKGTLSL